jgi:RimJ/RimL family protein N-acetyltransferase
MNLSFDGGTVRTMVLSDADSLARHGNDRDVWINLRDRFPHPYRREHAEAYIAHLATLPEPRTWVIDVGGEAVGSISITPLDDVERISAEVGYWIGREHWGKGIMTGALRAVTTHALRERGLTRVFAMPFATNAASIRVLEKAGYVREGFMRRGAIKDGKIIDQLLYGAYDDTWR